MSNIENLKKRTVPEWSILTKQFNQRETIDDLICFLKEKQKELPSDSEIEYGSSFSIYIRTSREETDEEYNSRIRLFEKQQKKNEKQRERRKIARLKRYEKLKKEFEN